MGALVAWAFNAAIDITVTATGTVVPSSSVKTLQNLEGGILQSLYVRPGDSVTQGQKVAQFNSVQYESELRALQNQLLAFQLRRDRLVAELESGDFSPDAKFYAGIPELLTGEAREFANRRSRLEGLRNSIGLAEAELSLISNLAARNLEPKAEVIRASLAVEERRSLLNQTMEQLASELNRTQTEIQTKEELIQSLLHKVERATIVSPVNGVVGELYAKTEGTVLAPGGSIMEIIPSEERLVVEGRIATSDVARLQVGMPAYIKITAYDFTVYGSLPGVVRYISPDVSKTNSSSPNSAVNAYIVRVEATTDEHPRIELRSGLDASIDIVTGERTIAQYLMAPFERTIDQAFKGG
jgi:adhesin transport system membrane fusion protein